MYGCTYVHTRVWATRVYAQFAHIHFTSPYVQAWIHHISAYTLDQVQEEII